MKQTRTKLYNALKTIPALGKVQSGWGVTLGTFPATIIYQAAGTSRMVADGVFTGNIEIWSIDCFAKTLLECDNMEEAVDTALRGLDGCLISKMQSTDLFEAETKVHHKVLRYQIKN